MMETFPDVIDVVVTPYTARPRCCPTTRPASLPRCRSATAASSASSRSPALRCSKATARPGNPHEEEDNRLARLAIRYILCNPAITAPIPGMINAQQVDNVALAVKERRELDVEERAELDRAMDRAWASLPPHYQWLKNWEYI